MKAVQSDFEFFGDQHAKFCNWPVLLANPAKFDWENQ